MMKNVLTVVLGLFLSFNLFSQELTADDRITITQSAKPFIGVYAFGYQGLPTSGYPQFQLNNYGGIPGTVTATADNSILGMFAFSGHNGSAKKTVGVIRVKSMDDFATALNSRMDFLIGPNREQRMTILGDSGYIGMGTDTPEGQLHIKGDTPTSSIEGFYTNLLIENTNAENYSSCGIVSSCISNPGYGYGGYFRGGNTGIYSSSFGNGLGGNGYGVYAQAQGTSGVKAAVYAEASNSGGSIAYGVNSHAFGATTNYGIKSSAHGIFDSGLTYWAGYFTTQDPGTSVYIGNTGYHPIGADANGNGLEIESARIGLKINLNNLSRPGNRYSIFSSSTTTGSDLVGFHYGVYAYANGSRNFVGANYSIYGAEGATAGSGTNWAGYFSGDVRITGTLDNTSDARLKKDIENIDNALNIIKGMQPKSYQFRTDEFPHMMLDERPQLGFVAQDMEKILPQLVRTAIHPEHVNQDGEDTGIPNSPSVEVKSINYIGIIPVLTQGIKELTQKIEDKDKTIEEMKEKMEEMSNMINVMNEKFNQIEKGMSSCCLNESNSQKSSINIELNGLEQPVLEQNAPNPFSEQTIIKYYLPSNTETAQMTITDIKGSPLKTVNLGNVGFGTVVINANELPVGTYIYTLHVDGRQIASKQMILVK